MPFATEVDLGIGDIGDPAPSPCKGAQHPHIFQPMSVVAKLSPISATAELLSYMCCLFILNKLSCVVHVIQMKVPVK